MSCQPKLNSLASTLASSWWMMMMISTVLKAPMSKLNLARFVAKALEGVNVKDLITAIGSGAAGADPAAEAMK